MTWYRSWLILSCAALLVFVLYFSDSSDVHADTVRVQHEHTQTLSGTPRKTDRLIWTGLNMQLSPSESPHFNLVDNALSLQTNSLNLSRPHPLSHPQTNTFLRINPRAVWQDTRKATRLTRLSSYTVHSGDTLWGISMDYNMSVATLKRINNLRSNIIYPGQKLHIAVASFLLSTASTHQNAVNHLGIPLNLIPIYQAAGRKYDIPWTVLAAIHRNETRFGTTQIFSSAGAEGPMQFMPKTFQYYGVTAPGRVGPPDINNVSDAIYSCAHMLKQEGYRQNPFEALYMYNHSSTYVHTIEQWAQRYSV